MQVRPVVDQATIIQRNVKRWQQDQAKRAEKQVQTVKEAAKRGVTVPQLLTQRRERWLLQNCRATIGQIIATQTKGRGVKP